MYKVGDAVVCVKDHPDGNESIKIGMTGIVTVREWEYDNMVIVRVKWDAEIVDGWGEDHREWCTQTDYIALDSSDSFDEVSPKEGFEFLQVGDVENA